MSHFIKNTLYQNQSRSRNHYYLPEDDDQQQLQDYNEPHQTILINNYCVGTKIKIDLVIQGQQRTREECGQYKDYHTAKSIIQPPVNQRSHNYNYSDKTKTRSISDSKTQYNKKDSKDSHTVMNPQQYQQSIQNSNFQKAAVGKWLKSKKTLNQSSKGIRTKPSHYQCDYTYKKLAVMDQAQPEINFSYFHDYSVEKNQIEEKTMFLQNRNIRYCNTQVFPPNSYVNKYSYQHQQKNKTQQNIEGQTQGTKIKPSRGYEIKQKNFCTVPQSILPAHDQSKNRNTSNPECFNEKNQIIGQAQMIPKNESQQVSEIQIQNQNKNIAEQIKQRQLKSHYISSTQRNQVIITKNQSQNHQFNYFNSNSTQKQKQFVVRDQVSEQYDHGSQDREQVNDLGQKIQGINNKNYIGEYLFSQIQIENHHCQQPIQTKFQDKRNDEQQQNMQETHQAEFVNHEIQSRSNEQILQVNKLVFSNKGYFKSEQQEYNFTKQNTPLFSGKLVAGNNLLQSADQMNFQSKPKHQQNISSDVKQIYYSTKHKTDQKNQQNYEINDVYQSPEEDKLNVAFDLQQSSGDQIGHQQRQININLFARYTQIDVPNYQDQTQHGQLSLFKQNSQEQLKQAQQISQVRDSNSLKNKFKQDYAVDFSQLQQVQQGHIQRTNLQPNLHAHQKSFYHQSKHIQHPKQLSPSSFRLSLSPSTSKSKQRYFASNSYIKKYEELQKYKKLFNKNLQTSPQQQQHKKSNSHSKCKKQHISGRYLKDQCYKSNTHRNTKDCHHHKNHCFNTSDPPSFKLRDYSINYGKSKQVKSSLIKIKNKQSEQFYEQTRGHNKNRRVNTKIVKVNLQDKRAQDIFTKHKNEYLSKLRHKQKQPRHLQHSSFNSSSQRINAQLNTYKKTRQSSVSALSYRRPLSPQVQQITQRLFSKQKPSYPCPHYVRYSYKQLKSKFFNFIEKQNNQLLKLYYLSSQELNAIFKQQILLKQVNQIYWVQIVRKCGERKVEMMRSRAKRPVYNQEQQGPSSFRKEQMTEDNKRAYPGGENRLKYLIQKQIRKH